DGGAWGKGHDTSGDGADPPVILERVVPGILLAAVIKDADQGSVRRDRERRLPLVRGRAIVIDLEWRTPRRSSVRRSDEEDVGLVGSGALVVVGDVESASRRIDGGVWELVGAEARRRRGSLPRTGQPQVAVDASDQTGRHRYWRAEGQSQI